MHVSTNRRLALLVTLASGALVLSACGSSEGGPAAAGGGDSIRVGQWISGAISTTALTSQMLAENEEITSAHDLKVEFIDYSNLQAQYTDLATGRIDVIVGGPESFASSAAKGAPLKLVGSFSRSNAAILSTGPELSADNLRGKRLVAATATSTWQLVRAQIKDLTGLEAEKDYQVVTADHSNAALQQLAAGTADFAMAWNESLIEGLAQFPNLTIVADHNELAGAKEPFIQFAIAVNSDNVDGEVAERLVAAYADQAAWMVEHADEADAKGVEGGRKDGTVKEMLTSGLVNYDIKPFPGPEADELRETLQVVVDTGKLSQLPPPSFFNEQS
ncbi:MAG: transporter substrate-binding domain-containing protein [Bowdeniella nasicola]|nr:transporter substrate-binding domain-containing protein [Bowdeniella nasicola]